MERVGRVRCQAFNRQTRAQDPTNTLKSFRLYRASIRRRAQRNMTRHKRKNKRASSPMTPRSSRTTKSSRIATKSLREVKKTTRLRKLKPRKQNLNKITGSHSTPTTIRPCSNFKKEFQLLNITLVIVEGKKSSLGLWIITPRYSIRNKCLRKTSSKGCSIRAPQCPWAISQPCRMAATPRPSGDTVKEISYNWWKTTRIVATNHMLKETISFPLKAKNSKNWKTNWCLIIRSKKA